MSIQGLICERVSVPGARDLLRITIEGGGGDLDGIEGAELVASDRWGRQSFQALPGSAAARAARTPLRSVGFAVPADLRDVPLTLELGDTVLPLPAPTERSAEQASRLLAAELRALELATAVSRAESDRLESEAALRRSEIHRHLAEQELAKLTTAADTEPAADAQPTADASESAAAPPRRRGRLAGWGSAVLLAAAVAAMAWPLGSDEHANTGGAIAASPPPLRSPSDDRLARRLSIPARYVALYRQTGRRYGLEWTMLAAVGHVETENGQSLLPGVRSGANSRGASGPAQFLAETWALYGLDGDSDGVRDPHDPADAIPAMASYLRASGAPGDWPGALLEYNHSQAYVAAVQRVAARYRALVRTSRVR